MAVFILKRYTSHILSCHYLHIVTFSERNYSTVHILKRKSPYSKLDLGLLSLFLPVTKFWQSCAISVSPSKFDDVETCSCRDDDVYPLPRPLPPIQTCIMISPSGRGMHRGLATVLHVSCKYHLSSSYPLPVAQVREGNLVQIKEINISV
jgi:hypothetical protein